MIQKLKSASKLSMVAGAMMGLSASLVPGAAMTAGAATSGAPMPPWYQAPNALQIRAAKAADFTGVASIGPNHEKPYPTSKINLTAAQIAKIKAGHFTAAISMHYMGNDWSTQQVAGISDEFKRLGIKVIAVTDANFKDTQQVSDLQAIEAKKPNVLVSIPVNSQTEESAYKAVAAKHIKIVFIGNVVDGMVPGKDYVSMISPDDFSNGMASADALAKAMHGKGNVAALYYASNFSTTNQRFEGFVARLKYKYPNIHLIATAGFNDPNHTQTVASALITKYPNLQAMWVAWDVPAMGAVSAAHIAGKNPNNFMIACEDLGNEAALNMAQNSFIKGLGAQKPYDQGVAEAKEAALSLIGGKTHPFVVDSSLEVDRSNLAKAYETVYHKSAPADVLRALKAK